MPITARYLGYAGLIPFAGLPVLTITGIISYYESYLYFTQYSAVILSFFGGVHWLLAISEQSNKHQLYVAMLPSIVAWLSLVLLSGEVLLGTLSIAYIAIFLYDKYVLLLPKKMIVNYIKLRLELTTIVVLTHLIMAYL